MDLKATIAGASAEDCAAAAAMLEDICAADGMPSLEQLGMASNGPYRAREERLRTRLEDAAGQLWAASDR